MVNSFQSRNDYTDIQICLLQPISLSPFILKSKLCLFLLAEGENLNDENLHNPGEGTRREKLRPLWYFSSELQRKWYLVAQLSILCYPWTVATGSFIPQTRKLKPQERSGLSTVTRGPGQAAGGKDPQGQALSPGNPSSFLPPRPLLIK